MGENEGYGEGLIVTDDLLMRYLLGELEEAERIRIQEQFFGDDLLFDRVLEAENDLIDQYARGDLGGRERELFENTILQRESMGQRVTFATALAAAAGKGQHVAAPRVDTAPTESRVRDRRRPLWYGLAAAAVLLVVLGVVWVRRNQELAGQRALSRATEQQASNDAPTNPTPSTGSSKQTEPPPTNAAADAREGDGSGQKSDSKRPMQAVGTFVLYPGSTRSSEEAQTLMIGRSIREVRLDLQLGEADEYKSYAVIVRTLRGSEILKKSGLSPNRLPSGKAVTVELAATKLAPGQYELELTGHPDMGPGTIVNYYYFTVAK